MGVKKSFSLKNYNTLGLDITTKYFLESSSIDEIISVLSQDQYKKEKLFIIGGGSNLLFKGDFNGLIIKPGFKDIYIVDDSPNYVYIKCGAGVEWDVFVEYCVDRGWGGIENLSYIPGTVGASPVQNIGAYGTEVKESITLVDYIDIKELSCKSITSEMMNFGYRDSIFKNSLKGRTLITHVTFKLSKVPNFNLSYQDVISKIEENNENLSLYLVRDIITTIRKNKLPEPSEIGNVGSFFKNPIVETKLALDIQRENPSLRFFDLENGYSKVPAAWLIDQCGFKGIREGNVGVHKNQALVLVAYSGATWQEVVTLSQKIKRSVKNRFNIDIEPEVNIVE